MKRKIFINDGIKPLEIEYSTDTTFYGDTIVTIYDDYKISLVLTDDCGAVIGDQIFFPQCGDIMIFRPSEIHFGRFPSCEKYKFISFFIPVDLFDRIFINCKSILSPFKDETPQKRNLIRLNDKYKNKIINMGEELLQIIIDEKANDKFDLIAFSKLIELLQVISDFYDQQSEVKDLPTVPPIITKTVKLLNESFPASIPLSELAAHCGCSVTYLTQTFRRYMGTSIHNYVTDRRLETAHHLIKSGRSVADACYQCGFSDCSRFILLYKQRYGVTPGKSKRSKNADASIPGPSTKEAL